jgi:CheY-like chemotaxis protein
VIGGSERILLVEDDLAVSAIGLAHLQSLGYEVISAADAVTALALLEDQEVDLVLTDIVMPGGVNGIELGRRVSATGLPVLYASGYASPSASRDVELVPGVNLLRKPYDRAELARLIRGALDAPRTREHA